MGNQIELCPVNSTFPIINVGTLVIRCRDVKAQRLRIMFFLKLGEKFLKMRRQLLDLAPKPRQSQQPGGRRTS